MPIPLVAAWRDTLRPGLRATQLLALDPAELSKPERALVRALGQVIDAVLDLPTRDLSARDTAAGEGATVDGCPVPAAADVSAGAARVGLA